MIEVLLGYRSVWRVLLLYSYSPGKGMVREEIKKLAGLRNVPLDSALRKLVLFGVLRQEGRLYRIDVGSEYAKKILELLSDMKRGLRGIGYELLIILDGFVREAVKAKALKSIILFGSHAKLTARKGSDVDLCVITSQREEKLEFRIQDVCESIFKESGSRIQVHYFTESGFEDGRKKKDPLVMDIIKDGIRLLPLG